MDKHVDKHSTQGRHDGDGQPDKHAKDGLADMEMRTDVLEKLATCRQTTGHAIKYVLEGIHTDCWLGLIRGWGNHTIVNKARDFD